MLVDDHPGVRVGMRELIDEQPDLQVIVEAATADEALAHRVPTIDVAIVDYDLGEGKDGLWLTAQLNRAEAGTRVLVYSAFADGGLAVLAVLAGADGLLGKHELPQVLCRAIRRLARGEHHLPAISPAVAHAMRSRLESRDQAIFSMLLHGIAPVEVAARLGITAEAVRLRRSIMLGSLRPVRGGSALPPGARAPLDYDRPKRRPGRRAA